MSLEIDQRIHSSELIPIRDLIAENSGLYFDDKKFYFIEKRIVKRVRATNSRTVKNYFRLLKLGKNEEEMKELITSLTTNETYFFRYLPQLESFSEEALPLICNEKRNQKDFTLNIWSAACSSGEEAYTILILLKESLPDFEKWKIRISATDIDHHVLEKAKVGIYDRRSVKDVHPKILGKYFKEEAGKFYVLPEMKEEIEFGYLNLMDRKEMRKVNDMDFVFCRNVLIYFSDNARKQVVNSIYNSLNPGGFIFLGHSESVGKISGTYKLVKFKKSLSYQK